MFYEIKLTVTKPNDKGVEREVKEHYLVNAELFGEAEMKGLNEYNGECDVTNIIRSRIREIVNQKEEEKPFFKATIVSVYLNDDGSEKEMKYPVLVCAEDVQKTTEIINRYMKEGLDDMRLDKVELTKIIDVI